MKIKKKFPIYIPRSWEDPEIIDKLQDSMEQKNAIQNILHVEEDNKKD